jgi:hypothetical protein
MYFETTMKGKSIDETWTCFLEILHKGSDQNIPHKFKRESKEPQCYNQKVRRELRRQKLCSHRLLHLLLVYPKEQQGTAECRKDERSRRERQGTV